MTESIGVVIPACDPDISSLEQYISAVTWIVDPEIIRVEIDAPPQEYIESFEDKIDQINVVPKQRGKESAIMTWFDALETDVLMFADADRSVPASRVADTFDK